MPVKDAAAHLPACLESLASQSLRDFELVAVENGSGDASLEILRAWKGGRFRLIEAGPGPSLPEALNLGLAACEGEFVARMDADDISLPGRFEAQLNLLKSGCGLAGAKVELFSDGPLSEGYQNYQAWINALGTDEAIRRERFIECPLPHPTWMAHREVFERVPYLDDGLPEDYHVVLRAAEAGLVLRKPEAPLLRWREHTARHSRVHPRYSRPAFMRLRARFLSKLRPSVVWGAGNRGRLLSRLLLEEGAPLKHVVGWSPKEQQPVSVHGIAVLPPEALPLNLDGPLIACVGEPGAREAIRAFCAGRGWAEGHDYWFAS
jgi:glycosyltransferase involved in cell wall biosynthesis